LIHWKGLHSLDLPLNFQFPIRPLSRWLRGRLLFPLSHPPKEVPRTLPRTSPMTLAPAWRIYHSKALRALNNTSNSHLPIALARSTIRGSIPLVFVFLPAKIFIVRTDQPLRLRQLSARAPKAHPIKIFKARINAPLNHHPYQ
jgi:hypothetical protein